MEIRRIAETWIDYFYETGLSLLISEGVYFRLLKKKKTLKFSNNIRCDHEILSELFNDTKHEYIHIYIYILNGVIESTHCRALSTITADLVT